MSNAKRIFIVEDKKDFTDKIFLSGIRKVVKGFIRLGHDVYQFDYGGAFWQVAPVMSKIVSRKWCKNQVDELLVQQLKSYNPDIIYVSFANFLDVDTIALIRQAAPNAFLVGLDGDPYPELQKNRVAIGSKLDLMLATNNGKWLDEYRKTGVRAAFMPNPCDPDIEYRYEVSDKWKTDILFTGQTKYKRNYPTEDLRYILLSKLADMKNCSLYGCLGRPKIGGLDYFYAISGAKIGVNINVRDDVKFYHSDRLTHYMAGGTFVLAKRMKDCGGLYKDGQHLKFFDTIDEFFELADRYLEHEDERKKIADAGMKWAHEQFNCVKIASYILELVDKGTYTAPWMNSK